MLKKFINRMKRRFSKSLGRRTHSNPDASISTLDEDDSFDLIDKLDHDPFLLILDQVQDPRNLGACLHTADGAGVDLVVLPNDRAAGITEVVRHHANGAVKIFLWQESAICPLWKNYLSVVSDCSVQVIRLEIYMPIIDDGSIRIGYGCRRYWNSKANRRAFVMILL